MPRKNIEENVTPIERADYRDEPVMTIANGGTASTEYVLPAGAIYVSLEIPAMTSGDITFKARADKSGSLRTIQKHDGSGALTLSASTGDLFVNLLHGAGAHSIQVVSATAQAAERTIRVTAKA